MDVSKHVEKAEEAYKKKNFDYAIGMLHQVLSLQPDNADGYRVLCATLRERAARKPTPAWLAKIVGSPFLLSSGMAKMFRNPASRARALTKYLKLEPDSPTVNMNLGQALAAAGHYKGAVSVFSSLGESDARNGDAWRMAAACHAKNKDVDAALECLEKALAANPRDAEAERMRKNLSADATLRAGTYDKAKSSRDLMKDKQQVEKLEKSQRMHRTEDELADEEAQLRAALDENSGDGRSRRRLAEILAKRQDQEAAIEVLEAGLDSDDNAGELRDKIGDLRLASLRREMAKLEERIDGETNEARLENMRGDLEDLQAKSVDLSIDEFRRRAEEQPTNLALQHSLGMALQEKGELDDAIGAFQKAVKDPKTRLDSLTRLGTCFTEKGLFDLAEKQLTAALEETSAASDEGKEILYNLGLIAEKAGRKEDAFGYFTRIYEIDIQYRDVSAKIEALKS